jgi:spermidine/putrescine transport system substrate-binding protein
MRQRTRSPQLGRRAVLAGLGMSALAGCADAKPETAAPQSTRPRVTPVVNDDGPITWANWPAYIDRKKKRRPTLDRFIAETGIQVNYKQPINDTQEFLDEITDGLEAGTSIGYDIIILPTWAAAQVITRGQAQPFGPVPRVDRVIPALAAPPWDAEQRFAMPWQSGLTGIAYDARYVDKAIGSITELFEREDLKGKVGMLTEWADTLGFALLAQGRDLRDLSEDMVDDGAEYVAERSRAGQFAGFYGLDFIDALKAGDLVASMAWSGDVLQAQLKNPYLKFVVPEEGLMIWSDYIVVPMGSSQAGAVAKLADYYYEPKVAAELAAWINYICPVVGAQEELAKISPSLAESPLIFPDSTILDRANQFPLLPDSLFNRMKTTFEALAAE